MPRWISSASNWCPAVKRSICSWSKQHSDLVRNHMRSSLIVSSLAWLLCQCQCFAADSSGHPSPSRQFYEQFCSIKTFAFGGVGPLGSMSDEEQCFRTIAMGSNALQLFTAALTNGTTEARLYALCGIRHLAPQAFDAHTTAFMAANKRVTIVEGCFV